MIDLNSGTLYIQKQDGSYEHFGEVTCTEATFSNIHDIPEYVPFINQSEFTFEFVAKVQKDLWLKLLGVYDSVISTCPNKKVVHLVLYGKNKKIRKKNFHRAIKILEKEN